MAKAKRTVYRDSETGRFVSKSKWERSRAHGGARYRRSTVSVLPRRVAPARPRALPPELTPEERFIDEEQFFEEEFEEVEYQGAFDTGKSKK